MKNKIHIVLGASGAIGKAVINELRNRNLEYKAVERSKKVVDVKTIYADLLNYEEALRAIKNANYVYLCVGLTYNSKVWERDWPILMRNVITACEVTNAKLIFFDNTYMYDPNMLSNFNELTSQNPSTKKGIARKNTTDVLLAAINENRIDALIARSADFFGENSINSPFYISFLENMLKGKTPQILGKKNIPHTYAFCEDNARALVELALNDNTYGQVWHLPVGNPITFDEINEMFNKSLNTSYKIQYVPKLLRKFLLLFVPALKEVEEMLYQFEKPFEMNFDKFKAKFPDFRITPYQEGINKMVKSFQ